MPLATGIQLGGSKPDLSLRYLINPEMVNLLSNGDTFANVSNSTFNCRLAQTLNTYFLLSQQFLKDPAGLMDSEAYFVRNISTPVDVGSLVEIYHASTGGVALFFLSSLVLLLSGVSSVVFTHMADGPEILGYASTVIRDSNIVDVQAVMGGAIEAGAMAAADLTLAMKNVRVRYGFIDSALERKALLGVGRERETRPIKNYLATDRDS